jgi:threonine/homoserine/homoserine lactone efflux protein
MDWSTYVAYVVFAGVVTLVPGPDFAVVTGNTMTGGRRRGMWCAVGVASSNALQGIAVVAGLGALVVRAQPVFQIIKWVGAAYLIYLGVRLLMSARRGTYAETDAPADGRAALRGWRQGFLSNITNPKVLMLYLAVLPQFLTADAGVAAMGALAVTHAALALAYLVVLTALLHRARTLLRRRPVRRALDAITGVAMIGFGARLALTKPA